MSKNGCDLSPTAGLGALQVWPDGLDFYGIVRPEILGEFEV